MFYRRFSDSLDYGRPEAESVATHARCEDDSAFIIFNRDGVGRYLLVRFDSWEMEV